MRSGRGGAVVDGHCFCFRQGHTKSIYSIKFMPDTNDHYLLSCSADKEVMLSGAAHPLLLVSKGYAVG
jgi:WD40 repeat protein